MERLQKIIAQSGYTSRREAEKLIQTGHVTVNGNLITTLGTKVNYEDVILIDGQTLKKDNPKVYYLLNKPRGYICSLKDEKERKVVTDLIDSKERIYPVGRLDYDTTGILILTNDGDLTNHLTHPKNQIEKTYLAKIEGVLDKKAIDALKKGVVVDNRKVEILRFKVTRKDIQKNTCFVELTIIEGRNHIVKNIFKELGYCVIKLSRIGYDFLTLDNLKSGEYRMLSIKEVKKLYRK